MNLVEDQPRLCIATDLPEFQLVRRGKVRDVYEVDGQLLMIATDRISAFDVVLPTPIPLKGAVLTQLSRFWFDMLRDLVPHHMISANVDEFPEQLKKYRSLLRLRTLLRLKLEMFRVQVSREVIARAPAGRSTARPARFAASSSPPGCARAIPCPNRSSRRRPRPKPA